MAFSNMALNLKKRFFILYNFHFNRKLLRFFLNLLGAHLLIYNKLLKSKVKNTKYYLNTAEWIKWN